MKAETKYEVGQTLWTIKDMRITDFKVRKIEVTADGDGVSVDYYPECGYCCHREANCFPSKDEMIEFLGL